MTPSHSKQ